MEKVVLFGAGAVARDAYLHLTGDSLYEVVAFTIDQSYLKEDTLFELPIVPFDEVPSIYPPDEYRMLVAVGYERVNRFRAEKYSEAQAKGYHLINCISSRAVTWPGLDIGENCLVGPNSIIHPSAKIGNNVYIGAGSLVPHDTIIGDHCFLAGNVAISGYVTVEPYCFLGPNSTIRNHITIARACVIGAGALILEDTQEREVYLGTSAERLPISSDKLPLA
jgi:sugar O-acyltransferase (sialic acid O-acetyltransferase NeuD family)